MCFIRIERNFAGVKSRDVNPSNHAENYQSEHRVWQLFIAIGQTEVMMRVNSSDKSVGDAERERKLKGVIMGQATLDLPDPLEKPPPASATSADDLLAQLAGDEIDRLLADADNGKSPAPAAPPPTVVESPGPALAPVAQAIVAEPEPAPISSPKPAAEPIATVPAAEVQAAQSPVEPDEIETGSPERTALAANELAQQSTDLRIGEDQLPFFLKPLVWLSSPLDSAPEAWREMIGKVAILTMVNAIAVLAYVIIFRRHH